MSALLLEHASQEGVDGTDGEFDTDHDRLLCGGDRFFVRERRTDPAEARRYAGDRFGFRGQSVTIDYAAKFQMSHAAERST